LPVTIFNIPYQITIPLNMKVTTLLSIVLSVVLYSACNRDPVKDTGKPKTEVPEVLQDGKSDFSFKKMGSRDGSMMHAIYNDLAKKDPQLQKLEEQLTHFREGEADSLKAFNNYDAKSDGYYYSANESLTDIKDTVLRAQLRTVIEESKARYMRKISMLSSLVQHIDTNKVKIEDYHTVLKIAATLPVIEKYQDQNIPDITSTANLANEAQRLKSKTLQLSRKYLPKPNTENQ
jgi:hypothetical protein